MKDTLLGLTQTILSSLDGDEVNSIHDTVESLQVATVIRTAYFDILGRANLPEHYHLTQLTASTDATLPIVMYIPEDVAKILWVKYDKQTADDTVAVWDPVSFKPVDDFLEYMHNQDLSDTTIETSPIVSGDIVADLYFRNDSAPSWYTVLGDNTIIFDSYDSAVDTTLQQSKTSVYAKKVVPFTLSDTFVPDLDEPQFALLLNEAKALAWAELKQVQHGRAERSARNGWIHLQHTKFAHADEGPLTKTPNYGRRR